MTIREWLATWWRKPKAEPEYTYRHHQLEQPRLLGDGWRIGVSLPLDGIPVTLRTPTVPWVPSVWTEVRMSFGPWLEIRGVHLNGRLGQWEIDVTTSDIGAEMPDTTLHGSSITGAGILVLPLRQAVEKGKRVAIRVRSDTPNATVDVSVLAMMNRLDAWLEETA